MQLLFEKGTLGMDYLPLAHKGLMGWNRHNPSIVLLALEARSLTLAQNDICLEFNVMPVNLWWTDCKDSFTPRGTRFDIKIMLLRMASLLPLSIPSTFWQLFSHRKTWILNFVLKLNLWLTFFSQTKMSIFLVKLSSTTTKRNAVLR